MTVIQTSMFRQNANSSEIKRRTEEYDKDQRSKFIYTYTYKHEFLPLVDA